MGTQAQYLDAGVLQIVDGRYYYSTGLLVDALNLLDSEGLDRLAAAMGFSPRPPVTSLSGFAVTFWGPILTSTPPEPPIVEESPLVPRPEPLPEPRDEGDFESQFPAAPPPTALTAAEAAALIEAAKTLRAELAAGELATAAAFEAAVESSLINFERLLFERDAVAVPVEQPAPRGPVPGLLAIPANSDLSGIANYISGQLEAIDRTLWHFPDSLWDGLIGALREAVDDAAFGSSSSLKQKLTGWIAGQLTPLLDIANVDRSDAPTDDTGGSAASELAIFAADSARAINGAVLATGIVVTLNIAAAAADGGTQLFSLGQIEGFQQLVQNLIWGMGLSDLGGLSFRPQIAASFAPLLERFWNDKSQAQIPGQGDLIRFLVREVFVPERRQELRSTDDLSLLYPFMRQRGFSDFWTDSFWAAHWNLLSATQLNEALHRGIIGMDEWERQMRFNDVVPEGIPWLKEIIFQPFTRVDVRRMENLGILDDQQLLQSYADIGYFAPVEQSTDGRFHAQFVGPDIFNASVHKAQANVLFAKLFNALPTLRRRLSNGFVRPVDVEGELLELGLPPDTAQRVSETLVKAEDLGVAEQTRELTTSQIVRGVKAGLISFNQGDFLLREIGWGPARAEFMLRLRVAPEGLRTATLLGSRLITRVEPPVFEAEF